MGEPKTQSVRELIEYLNVKYPGPRNRRRRLQLFDKVAEQSNPNRSVKRV